MYPADFYLTYDKATSSWTPSTEFSTMTADEWNYNYNITSWGAVWTRNEGASRVENYVSLSSETSDGQETLVSKEGTMISFDTETFTWNIKLVMGQPEGFCKVTVEGLNDENYYLQVTGAQTTAEMKYTNNLNLTTGSTSYSACSYMNDKPSSWYAISGSNYAGKGYLEDGNMCYYFSHADAFGDPSSVTYFVLANHSELYNATKIFFKVVSKIMPWTTGKGVKIKGPTAETLSMKSPSVDMSEADANGWVCVFALMD